MNLRKTNYGLASLRNDVERRIDTDQEPRFRTMIGAFVTVLSQFVRDYHDLVSDGSGLAKSRLRVLFSSPDQAMGDPRNLTANYYPC